MKLMYSLSNNALSILFSKKKNALTILFPSILTLRVCLDMTYFTETENLLLKSL